MGTSTIPLAKGFNEKKVGNEGFLSVKLDGVPMRLDFMIAEGRVTAYHARTRQGEAVESANWLVLEWLTMVEQSECLTDGAYTVVGELTDDVAKNFKDVSGIVRRQSRQDTLRWNLFDFYSAAHKELGFGKRLNALINIGLHVFHSRVLTIPQLPVRPENFEGVKQMLLDRYVDCEGLIYRNANDLWEPNKRGWGYMKMVHDPTMDLQVVGFEEAKCSKTGEGKGMVGRINVDYKGTTIGCGPGKMSHKERKDVWALYKLKQQSQPPEGVGEWPQRAKVFATIKYKRDPSYDALRQPTFQHWRPEKTEASYE